MGAAAYNRGTRNLSAEADAAMTSALVRAERLARDDENARLRRTAETLERDLARARRCIAELRRAKDARMTEAWAALNASDCAVSILCRLAFGAQP